jgi:murein DD-endopeptidase / murein LD-carboxypeptidase
MKKFVATILFLIPAVLFSQNKYDSPDHYFSERNLFIDSSSNPFLYYKIFDWLGTRYKYSGKTENGIDCSGFVSEIYKNVYCTELSGGSRDIFKLTQPVNKTSLQEGDLLFFKIKKGNISHVGVYLGNNKFVHATTRIGVTVSDLDEPYYKKYFYKGGRLVQQNTINQ